jgi:PD-(D/E)XK endonuclease
MAIPRKFLVSFKSFMKNHHTKGKGDLGVLKAQADLCLKGYLICLPLSEHSPFDIVVYKNGIFKRVQVKARSLRRGSLTVRFEHSYSDSKGVHTKKIDIDSIDTYCVYCLDTDECYYFSAKEFKSKTTINLRVNSPKNSQGLKINWAKDYQEVP